MGIEVKWVHPDGFVPKGKSLFFFPFREGHYSFLIADVRLLPHERLLHLVERSMEEFLVLFDKDLTDLLQFALPLRNLIDVDALNEDLDERGGLWVLRPCQREGVQ